MLILFFYMHHQCLRNSFHMSSPTTREGKTKNKGKRANPQHMLSKSHKIIFNEMPRKTTKFGFIRYYIMTKNLISCIIDIFQLIKYRYFPYEWTILSPSTKNSLILPFRISKKYSLIFKNGKFLFILFTLFLLSFILTTYSTYFFFSSILLYLHFLIISPALSIFY